MTAIAAAAVSLRTLADEIWRPVVGYEGLYSVSDHGRAMVHDRIVRHWRGGVLLRPARILKPGMDTDGYLHYGLTDASGLTKTRKAHALVLAAFVGPKPAGMLTAHWDGDRTNNHLGNLRYATPTGNCDDKKRHGTQPRGERTKTAKLTPEQVFAIRASTRTDSADAKEFGIGRTQVRRIKANEAWSHL